MVKIAANEETKKEKQPRKLLTISETKLKGAVVVIKEADCIKLGIDPTLTTKEIVKAIRGRLGI